MLASPPPPFPHPQTPIFPERSRSQTRVSVWLYKGSWLEQGAHFTVWTMPRQLGQAGRGHRGLGAGPSQIPEAGEAEIRTRPERNRNQQTWEKLTGPICQPPVSPTTEEGRRWPQMVFDGGTFVSFVQPTCPAEESPACCMTWGKLLHFSAPQFSHLQNGDKNSHTSLDCRED